MRQPIPSQCLQFTVQDQYDCYFNHNWYRLVLYLSMKCVFLLSDKQSYIDFVCLVYFFFFFFFLSFSLLVGFCSFPSGIVASHSLHFRINVSSCVFWRLTLSIVVEVFPRPFFRMLLLQGCLLQTRYA